MTGIVTDRLLLRRPGPQDLDAYVAYFDTDRAAMNGGPLPPGRAWRAFAAQLGAWELNGFGMFAITCKGDERIRGMVGPWCPGDWPEREIGWSLFDPADEGRGIAQEAAAAVLDHVWADLGWDTAVSYIRPQNARSRALAERLGATLDAGAEVPDPAIPTLVYRHPRRSGKQSGA